MNTVEVDRHGVTTLAKWLDPTGCAELMVDDLFIELIGGQIFFTRYFYLALRDKRQEHPLTFAVATIAAHAFSKISLHPVRHCAAVTAPVICFHANNPITQELIV